MSNGFHCMILKILGQIQICRDKLSHNLAFLKVGRGLKDKHFNILEDILSREKYIKSVLGYLGSISVT